MIAEPISQFRVVSPSAAPLTPDYPQFTPAEIPTEGGAIRAWKGHIKPFEEDCVAKYALRKIEADHQLWLAAGQIRGGEVLSHHWADPLLVGMAQTCEVLICEHVAEMPRAYLLSPRYLEHYDNTEIHPHPRGDQMICYRGARIPGLCVFSSAEFTVDPAGDFFTQFLDQVSQYIAKHLIWLRTRRLLRRVGSDVSTVYQPRSGELIIDVPPRFHLVQTLFGVSQAVDYWSGYWPGPKARATSPLEHIQQIKSSQRCYCGREQRYGDCHRPRDLAKLSETYQRRYGPKNLE